MLQWQERQTNLNLIPQESKIGWHRTESCKLTKKWYIKITSINACVGVLRGFFNYKS